jgi:uncharacterized protein YbjQ (UPF0145 family)
MPIKKRILKNKNKNTFYKKKRMMKGGEEPRPYQEDYQQDETRYESSHSGLLGVLQQAATIFSMGANIVVDKVTKMLNLDLSQLKESSSSLSTEEIKQILQEKLTQINEALKDPETMAKLQELAKTIGEKGGIILEAAAPSIKKAFFKLIEIVAEGGTKMAQAMIKFILDVAGTVPIFGEVVEAVRVLDDIVKAFQATQQGYLEAYTANVDSITETIRRFNDMVNQYKQGNQYDDADEEDIPQLGGALAIKKRIVNSISKFYKTNKVKRRVKKQTRKNKRRYRK